MMMMMMILMRMRTRMRVMVMVIVMVVVVMMMVSVQRILRSPGAWPRVSGGCSVLESSRRRGWSISTDSVFEMRYEPSSSTWVLVMMTWTCRPLIIVLLMCLMSARSYYKFFNLHAQSINISLLSCWFCTHLIWITNK